MKKAIFTIIFTIVFGMAVKAESDIVVLNDGTLIKAYNLDYSSSDKCYYSLDEAGENMKFVKKADIMIIKLANGTKIDPNGEHKVAEVSGTGAGHATLAENPGKHAPVTYTADMSSFIEISGKEKRGESAVIEKFYLVPGDQNQLINIRILSDTDKTVAVSKPRKKMKYEEKVYIIPEYVKIGDNTYTVTEIDGEAFRCGAMFDFKNIKKIVLPSTLKIIGPRAFYGRQAMESVYIPDSVETIGSEAFSRVGYKADNWRALWIPKSVKNIGENAFWATGHHWSPKGKYQGPIDCMPDFITPETCDRYGIDDSAIEEYRRKHDAR